MDQLRSVVNLYLVGDSSWTSSSQLCLQQFLPFLLCLRQMLVYSSGASLARVGFPTGSSRRRAIRFASVLLASTSPEVVHIRMV